MLDKRVTLVGYKVGEFDNELWVGDTRVTNKSSARSPIPIIFETTSRKMLDAIPREIILQYIEEYDDKSVIPPASASSYFNYQEET